MRILSDVMIHCQCAIEIIYGLFRINLSLKTLYYSSSKTVSFISGKSNNSETVIFKPVANLCKVFNFGFLFFPL